MNKMVLKDFRPAVFVTLGAAVLFGIHTLLFQTLNISQKDFYHSLLELYLFFAGSSLLIVVLLVFVNQKNKDYVGYTFMLLTCVKMAVSYFFLHPILQLNDRSQKINFFTLFMLFLTIETIVTIRILNNKQ